jgi:hypothetical protein
MKDAAYEGFGFMGGALGAMAMFMFVALLFFIPGLLILASQHKKPKDQRNTGLMVLAYILLFMGVIFGFGMGSGFTFDNLMSNV